MSLDTPAFFNFNRKTLLSLVAVAALSTTALVGSMSFAPPASVHAESYPAIDPTKGFSQLVDEVMPSVVSVTVKIQDAAAQTDGQDGSNGQVDPQQIPPQLKDFFDQFPQFGQQFKGMKPQPRGPEMAQGSGFVITKDGYVVTNNHVVDKASEVSVKFQNGEEYDATVVGTDPKTDIALLKIKSDRSFPAVSFATTEAKVGDWVMAVGNPFGLGGTVTSGIISARGRDLGNGPYDDFLQVDASINHGNSGGPDFNLNGEVIGMNTAIFSPSGGSVGIGFAIPASIISSVVDSLKKDGNVTRGWLGVRIQPVTADIAESLGLAKPEGAMVSEVTEGSPALKGGIKQGDTILTVDGTQVADARDLSRIVAKVKPGKEVEFSILRDGKPQTIKVAIGTMPTDTSKVAAVENKPPAPANLSVLGLKLAPADDGAGVKVVDVKPSSAAADHGLKAGDVILEVAGKEVNNSDDVTKAMAAGNGKRVLLLVKTEDGQRFVALPRGNG
jgi:serine protease Do